MGCWFLCDLIKTVSFLGTQYCSYCGPDSHSGRPGHSSWCSRLVVLCGEEEKTDWRDVQTQCWGAVRCLQCGPTRCPQATKGGKTYLSAKSLLNNRKVEQAAIVVRFVCMDRWLLIMCWSISWFYFIQRSMQWGVKTQQCACPRTNKEQIMMCFPATPFQQPLYCSCLVLDGSFVRQAWMSFVQRGNRSCSIL